MFYLKKKTRMVTYPNLPTCCAQNEKHIPCYNNKIPNYTLIRIKLHHEHTVMSIILKPHQVFNESWNMVPSLSFHYTLGYSLKFNSVRVKFLLFLPLKLKCFIYHLIENIIHKQQCYIESNLTPLTYNNVKHTPIMLPSISLSIILLHI